MRKVLMSLLVAATVATTMTSCEKEEVVVPGKAKVMVVHASPDAPGVDLLVDNAKQNTAALNFLQNTAYLSVNEGTRNIKVNAAGTTNSVINKDVPFTKDMSYTLFAGNKLANIEPILITDDLTAPAAGKAHVRFVHLSPDAPAVDVAVTGGNVLFPNVAFKGNSAFSPVAAGTVPLEARAAGTNNVALSVGNVTFTAGKIYTVYARGLISNGTLNVSIIENN
ncbi:MAG: hypothetical protein RL660_2670 [Bacteroidota bacterium]|jgi:hypothetical protein